MSDMYGGPSVSVRVRFTRDWGVMRPVKAGEVFDAKWYPHLRQYYIGAPVYAYIGTHPMHEGLIESVTEKGPS